LAEPDAGSPDVVVEATPRIAGQSIHEAVGYSAGLVQIGKHLEHTVSKRCLEPEKSPV
jgi:hypothetical protein